jgi:hypothetical protein
LSGENPYSDEVTTRIQEGMFGQQLRPQEDQQRFAYSALITWLLLPFWLLPFPYAISLWCGLQFLLLLVLPLGVYSLLNWRIRPVPLILILFFSIFVYRYPINAYLLGQFIPFSLACLVTAWYGLAHNRQTLMTIALILAMVRPEIVLLPLLALLVIAWEMGYRRVIVAWIIGMGSLWLLTRAWIGSWEMDFLRGLVAYQVYSFPVWPPGLLNHIVSALFLVAIMVVWSAWLWRDLRQLGYSERIGWALSFTNLTELVVFPQTGNYTLIMGLIAIWLILWVAKRHYGYWMIIFAILSSPWVFVLGKNELISWERLFIPLSISIVLTICWLNRKRFLASSAGEIGIEKDAASYSVQYQSDFTIK